MPTNSSSADISVVIPVKDRADDLRLAVRSALAQTVLPREVIIVDDGSRIPVAAEWFGDLGAVTLRILRKDVNKGAAAACNTGLEAASCAVVAFLDSDDYFATTYIQEVSAAWDRSGQDVVCIATGFWWCTNDLEPYRVQIVERPVDRDTLLRNGNIVGGNSVLSVRREAASAVGGFPDQRGSYDWGLLLRLSRVGRIVTIPEPLLFYRSPSASLLATDTMNFRRQIVAVTAIAREQPRPDRLVMQRLVYQSMCSHLAQSGRRRLATRCLRAYVRRYGVSSPIIRAAAINTVGAGKYWSLLHLFAQGRAYLNRHRPARAASPLK